MNTLYFRYAVEVERAGSFTQAADRLYMAQPNLSKAIRELEDTLGFAIFERTPRGVHATARGSEFLEIAKAVILQLDRMEALSQPEAVPTFSASLLRADYLTEAAARFASELDIGHAARLRLEEVDSVHAIHHVAEGRTALGVIRYDPENASAMHVYAHDRRLHVEPLWTFSHRILVPERHPLARKATLCAEDLRTYVEVALEEPELLHPRPGRELTERRVAVGDRNLMHEMLEVLRGAYSWTAPMPAKAMARYGFVQIECPDAARVAQDALIHAQNRTLVGLERRFVERIHEVLAELTKNASDAP